MMMVMFRAAPIHRFAAVGAQRVDGGVQQARAVAPAALARVDDELADGADPLLRILVRAGPGDGERDDSGLADGDEHAEVRERWADDGVVPRAGRLVGDETAAPAICAIIESLGADARGLAVIEVPSAEDALHVDAPAGMTVKWLAREGARGERLTAEVRDWVARTCAARCCDTCDIAALEIPDDELLWEVPEGTSADGGLYAWLAGEAGVIRSLRRFLVGDAGMDRRRVAFMGYWRVGAEG